MRWDDTYAVNDMTIGYEDRLLGAMEMPLGDFVPIGEGGDLPMHRVWYVRSGESVLWDRRRKLDLVFGSGMTSSILAGGVECLSEDETIQRIEQGKANVQMIEEERQHKLDVQLHAQRHAEARAAGTLPRPTIQSSCSSALPLQSNASAVARQGLVFALFRLCDADGDGFLSKQEMYLFATLTGFDGNEEEWTEEFGLLCSENFAKVDVGLDATVFKKLLDDESDSGCFCTDAELEQTATLVLQKTGQLPEANW